ncbi:hypothetical protein DIPPA_23397 [Diplonema papillatum]|nr:hypothetical protein DIPPA_23397 [Diplonema papillatum]
MHCDAQDESKRRAMLLGQDVMRLAAGETTRRADRAAGDPEPPKPSKPAKVARRRPKAIGHPTPPAGAAHRPRKPARGTHLAQAAPAVDAPSLAADTDAASLSFGDASQAAGGFAGATHLLHIHAGVLRQTPADAQSLPPLDDAETTLQQELPLVQPQAVDPLEDEHNLAAARLEETQALVHKLCRRLAGTFNSEHGKSDAEHIEHAADMVHGDGQELPLLHKTLPKQHRLLIHDVQLASLRAAKKRREHYQSPRPQHCRCRAPCQAHCETWQTSSTSGESSLPSVLSRPLVASETRSRTEGYVRPPPPATVPSQARVDDRPRSRGRPLLQMASQPLLSVASFLPHVPAAFRRVPNPRRIRVRRQVP